MKKDTRTTRRLRRHTRVTSRIRGSRGSGKPRLVVFRSRQHISAQLIDDEKGVVLAFASDKELKEKGKKKPIDCSREVGTLVAKKALSKNIKAAAFDRAGYKYHGNVKALAEGAREGGLQL